MLSRKAIPTRPGYDYSCARISRLTQTRHTELPCQLLHARPQRILSSPLVRCLQTVQPLADVLRIVVEPHPALAEGARLEDTWALLEALAGDEEAVLCSHGDVIPPVLDRLARRGVPVQGAGRRVTKGSIWTIEGANGSLTTARLAFAP